MDSQTQKYGVEETLDVLEGGKKIIDTLTAHASDDGRISTFEWAQTALTEAPTLMEMIRGSDLIDDEIKELDRAELEQVAKAGLEMAKSVRALVEAFKRAE